MSSHLIEDALIVHETYHDKGEQKGKRKAILVEAMDFEENEWIPYSAVHDDSEVHQVGDCGDLLIKEYWAEKKGWI